TGTGTQSPDKTVTVVSTGGAMDLDLVAGEQDVAVDGLKGVDLETVRSGQGSLLLTSLEGDIRTGTATAGQNVTMLAMAGAITTGVTKAEAGDVDLEAHGDIDAADTTAGGDVRMLSETGDIRSGTATGGQNVILQALAGAITTGVT